MIPDKFFYWPSTMSLQPAIDYLKPLFMASPVLNAWETSDTDGVLSEYIALVCRQWNINPAWVVVCLEREQTLMDGQFPSPDKIVTAIKAACGFVGQDSGRAERPGYYGVYPQVYRCVEQSAWLLGKLPPECWRELIRTSGRPGRWRPGIKMEDGVAGVPGDIFGERREDGKVLYTPLTAGEYVQLMYTPHWETLAVNERIARKFGPQFF